MNIHQNAKTTPKMRALIVARRQAGETSDRIAGALGVSVATVNKWLARHAVEGAAGLVDRSSRPLQPSAPATDPCEGWATVRGGGLAPRPPAVLADRSLGRPVARHRGPDRKILRVEPLIRA